MKHQTIGILLRKHKNNHKNFPEQTTLKILPTTPKQKQNLKQYQHLQN